MKKVGTINKKVGTIIKKKMKNNINKYIIRSSTLKTLPIFLDVNF